MLMSNKSLAAILKLRLWILTLFTSLFFIATGFFFLFAMEDYAHEQQLITLSDIVATNPSIDVLPNHIQLYNKQQIPASWLTLLKQNPLNKALETTDLQGNITHILQAKFIDTQHSFVLALDTTKTHSVWEITDKLLILILPWIIVFLVVASFLATTFTRQIQRQFSRLLTTLKNNESPDALAQFAQNQPIDEVKEFAQLFMHVWQQKIEIISREKQSLEYLSHELRTPIQSSLATLELLALTTQDRKPIERLTRALNRMTRLSNCVLYLMESEKELPTYQVDILSICEQLTDELKPLADINKQSMVIHASQPLPSTTKHSELLETPFVTLMATQEVIETLLSILLTNALQHSNNAPIIITVNQHEISIRNERSLHSQDHQGFGIGLTIARRLAEKFSLNITISIEQESQVIATISAQ